MANFAQIPFDISPQEYSQVENSKLPQPKRVCMLYNNKFCSLHKLHNFITERPLSSSFGGHVLSKDIDIGPLNYTEQYGYPQYFVERLRWKRGLHGVQSFWSFKKSTVAIKFRSNEPFPDILRPLVRHDHHLKKINTHPWPFFFGKKDGIHILKIGVWNVYRRFLQ